MQPFACSSLRHDRCQAICVRPFYSTSILANTLTNEVAPTSRQQNSPTPSSAAAFNYHHLHSILIKCIINATNSARLRTAAQTTRRVRAPERDGGFVEAFVCEIFTRCFVSASDHLQQLRPRSPPSFNRSFLCYPTWEFSTPRQNTDSVIGSRQQGTETEEE